MPETYPTVVVLTALPVEYDAVRAHIEVLDDDEIVLGDGTRLERGRLPGTPWTVAIAELGEGALTAAALTTRIVSELHPEALLFVGVAGGLKDDLEIGDVVVGTKVYAIHGGKEAADGFLARPEAWHGSHRLLQAARSALRGLDGVRGHRKPLACGDVVLADERSALRGRIQRTYNDAYAIEMEGSGASHAAHLSGQLDALVIRGISDLADAQKADADAGGSQELAAAQAAKVAVAVLRKHRPRVPASVSSDTEEGPRYGGDHIDFRGSTFNGTVIGKIAGRP
ncbi:5'-methylthioadenosine/S-adenosylhomocysteine nucleosidase [Streptomyces aurantiogriseus]|uniref:Nucleosidase n=1 Tax=Streptomyces aurantiogriseus TaxID=66870 RepID=A0A918KYL7_9ACTN|nr:5'-methylthioadenosine/S-adenosylhomocysteine nucleosidase [Streptomyces aurantiogriseus]GGR49031.1 nucleosidase [Streptomyces aurantiogriseus]